MTSPPLAIDGGAPVRSAPMAPWPHFDDEMVEAVTRVLRSGRVNYWTGTETRAFEAEYAASLGVQHAIAVANGTVSIEILLRCLGIGKGDEVITTPRTFVGTATAIVAVGARPVFADVDPDSGNLDPNSVDAVITPRTRAILPVHLGGWPCDMDALRDLASGRGITVIEDCAQSHGATWKGRPTGALGHASSFSFCQDKIITTGGEGGLIATDDEALWRACWAYKDHGKSWDAVYEREHPPGFRWLVESFGTNLRMTEMQAAIGRIALRRLPAWTAQRTRLAKTLIDATRGIDGFRIPEPANDADHAWYRVYAQVDTNALRSGWDRDRIQHAIAAEGIPCFSGSCSEIYLERAFDAEGLRPDERLPVARSLGETSLAFLVHPTLDVADMQDAAAAVRRVFAHALR